MFLDFLDSELQWRNDKNQRLTKQISELMYIRYKMIAAGEMIPSDENDETLTRVVDGFIWLYEKGLSLESNLREILINEELERYDSMLKDFSKLNQFLSNKISIYK